MTVREAEPTGETVERLIALSAEWEAEGSCHGYRKNAPEDIAGNRVFVALEGGEIAGYLFGHAQRAAQATCLYAQGERCFEIEELYVRPQHRDRGIGRALFRCAEQAIADQADVILLSTATKNYKAVLHFYIDELGMEFWNARLVKRLRRPGP